MADERDDFDQELLHALVDQILRGPGDVAAGTQSGEGHRSAPASRKLPFGIGDTVLFEAFANVLQRTLDGGDVQLILDEVRTEYLQAYRHGDLRTLHTLVKNCHKCPDMEEEGAVLPQGNLANPDVVIVHELPPRPGTYLSSWKSFLSEAGFDERYLCHSSLVRCDPKGARLPVDTEISTCTQMYLFTEIQLLSPKLIITSGSGATKAFLGDIDTLGEYRGKVHWLGPWAVLPTYALGYVNKAGANAEGAFRHDLETAYNFCYGS